MQEGLTTFGRQGAAVLILFALLELGLIARSIAAHRFGKVDTFVLSFMAFYAIVILIATFRVRPLLDKITLGAMFAAFAVGIFRNVVNLSPEDQLASRGISLFLWVIILVVNTYLFIRLSKAKSLPQ